MKIYHVVLHETDHYFFYIGNARETGEEFETLELSRDQVQEMININCYFPDLESYLEANPAKFDYPLSDAEDIKEDINFSEISDIDEEFVEVPDLDDLPEPEPEKQTVSLEDFLSLKSQLQNLADEYEVLKKEKNYDFETVEKLIKEKGKLLRELRVFESQKENIFTYLESIQNESSTDLETDCARIDFQQQTYPQKSIFAISNKAIILDFLGFILRKINEKIEFLKSQISDIQI